MQACLLLSVKHASDRLSIDVLAKRDRHRAPHFNAAFLIPGHAILEKDGADVDFRAARDGSWAEIEWEAGTVQSVVYELEVQFASDVPVVAGLSVLGVAGAIARATFQTVHRIRVAAIKP